MNTEKMLCTSECEAINPRMSELEEIIIFRKYVFRLLHYYNEHTYILQLINKWENKKIEPGFQVN